MDVVLLADIQKPDQDLRLLLDTYCLIGIRNGQTLACAHLSLFPKSAAPPSAPAASADPRAAIIRSKDDFTFRLADALTGVMVLSGVADWAALDTKAEELGRFRPDLIREAVRKVWLNKGK